MKVCFLHYGKCFAVWRSQAPVGQIIRYAPLDILENLLFVSYTRQVNTPRKLSKSVDAEILLYCSLLMCPTDKFVNKRISTFTTWRSDISIVQVLNALEVTNQNYKHLPKTFCVWIIFTETGYQSNWIKNKIAKIFVLLKRFYWKPC